MFGFYLFIYLYVLFQQGGSISGQTLFFVEALRTIYNN